MKKLLLPLVLVLLMTSVKAQSIYTTALSSTSFCSGVSFTVYFTAYGTYNSGNVFTVQLSNSLGSFSSPVSIGSTTYVNSTYGSTSVTIPVATAQGSSYRIRVVSSNPAVTGSDNGANITINAVPAAPTLSESGHGCLGIDSLTTGSFGGAGSITWQGNGNTVETVSAYAPLGIVAGASDSFTAHDQLWFPTGIFLDKNGNLYVADANNARVLKFPAGSTSATNGVIVAGGNGSGSTAYQLGYPTGVYVDASGNVYVADFANDRVQEFPAGSDSTTMGITVAGGNGKGASANQFDGANGVYLDSYGNIYVSDYNNGRVQEFPAGSNSLTSGTTVAGGNGYGSDANQLGGPRGVFIDSLNNLYVADAMNNRVQKFPYGSTSNTNGTTVAAQLAYPQGIFVDGSGYLYVADFYVDAVVKFPPGSDSTTNPVIIAGGNLPGNAANDLEEPIGVVVDKSGNVYVSDYQNNRIQKFPPNSNSSTNAVTVAGGNGNLTDDKHFEGPVAVCTDSTGNIYVLDQGNNRVQKFPPGSTASTAGITAAGGNQYGPGLDQLFYPAGMYVDAKGDIYVADQGNNRVMKFPAGSNSLTNGTIIAGDGTSGVAANQLNNPGAVFVDGGGNIYVLDNNNYRVQKFPANSDSSTAGVTVAGGNGFGVYADQFSEPNDIFVDATGNLYVADANRILLFPDGSTSSTYGMTVAGSTTAGNALNQLSYASGVTVDKNGNVFVSDGANNRIMEFPAGSDSLASGIAIAPGDGVGSGANQLNGPLTIYLDKSGNLYVGDGQNECVKKWGPLSSTSYMPTDTGVFTTTYISLAGCKSAVSNPDTIHPVVPGISLAVTAGSLTPCAGSPVTFTGSPSNAGNVPVYNFMVNDTSIQNGASAAFTSSALNSGDAVKCIITSDAACSNNVTDTSNALVVHVYPLPDPVISEYDSDDLFTGNFNNYQWFRNDSIILYANDQNYFPGQNGVYTVFVIDANGCSDTSAPFNFTLEGINQLASQNNLKLYPNPNNGSFLLETTNSIHQPYIIYDMLGNKVWQDVITADKQVVELKGLAAGSYMVRVGNSEVGKFECLIIQK